MARTVAVLAVASLGLGACDVGPQSDRRWVSNSKERMFTRIPKKWNTFVINPYKTDIGRVTGLQRSTSRWSMILDSRSRAKLASSRAALRSTLPLALVGEMSVRPIPADWTVGSSDTLREDLSVSAMRSFSLQESLGAKPTAFPDPVKHFLDGDPAFEVITYKETATKNGLRGVHLRFNYEVSNGKWLTIDQQVLVDRATSKLYRLVLKCEASCFKRSYNDVKRISSSWTVKK